MRALGRVGPLPRRTGSAQANEERAPAGAIEVAADPVAALPAAMGQIASADILRARGERRRDGGGGRRLVLHAGLPSSSSGTPDTGRTPPPAGVPGYPDQVRALSGAGGGGPVRAPRQFRRRCPSCRSGSPGQGSRGADDCTRRRAGSGAWPPCASPHGPPDGAGVAVQWRGGPGKTATGRLRSRTGAGIRMVEPLRSPFRARAAGIPCRIGRGVRGRPGNRPPTGADGAAPPGDRAPLRARFRGRPRTARR